jgi:hypothetical protein
MKRQKISPEVLFGEGAKQNWKESATIKKSRALTESGILE